MKITVKNFGPIREAKDIRVSPMTLFVGPSNTGKSYLAVLLYSVADALEYCRRHQSVMDTAMLATNNPQKRDWGNDYIDSAMKSAKLMVNSLGTAKTKNYAKDLARKMFMFWAEITSEKWREKMSYCFTDENKNVFYKKDMSVILVSDNGDILLNLTSPKNSDIKARTVALLADKMISGMEKKQLSAFPVNPAVTILSLLDVVVTNNILSEIKKEFQDFYYLPAARSGIMQTRRVLVRNAVRHMAENPRHNSPMLTGILSDYIQKLDYQPFINPSKRRMDFSVPPDTLTRNEIINIGHLMEKSVMSGTVVIKKNEAGAPLIYYRFSDQGKTRTMSLLNTSSMVAELTPVSIFIRYYLRPGDLFILEEPESHLHPEGQRLISDILVRLANAGVFVLATTHSEIVLEQISNAVHASEVPSIKKSGGKKRKFQPIERDKTSVYSFAPGKSGTVVKPHKFDKTTGLVTLDHLKAAEDMYNESVELLNGKNGN